jgi:hypothetical protein
MPSRLPAALNSDIMKTVCPSCGSSKVESLSPAIRDWLSCGICGHIWPRVDKPDAVPPEDLKVRG